MSVVEFRADLVHTDGQAVVAVRGEVDAATADQLWTAIEQAIAHSPHVVLDLAQMTFIDSSGLAVLVRTRRQVLPLNGSVLLRTPTPTVTKILDITGLSKVFPLQDAAASDGPGNLRAS